MQCDKSWDKGRSFLLCLYLLGFAQDVIKFLSFKHSKYFVYFFSASLKLGKQMKKKKFGKICEAPIPAFGVTEEKCCLFLFIAILSRD